MSFQRLPADVFTPVPVAVPVPVTVPVFEFNGRQEFSKCLSKLVDSPNTCGADVVFGVGGQRLGGQRITLSLRSDVFRCMFNGDFKEASTEQPVSLHQFDHVPHVFREFLVYMHTGQASLDDLIDVSELFKIASYFGVDQLKKFCEAMLLESPLSGDAAVALLKFSEEQDLQELRARIAKEIFKLAGTILADAKKVVPFLSQAFLRELFAADDVNVTETMLFRMAQELDAEMQQEMIRHVRLALIPAKTIMDVVLPSGLVSKDACLEALAFQADPRSVDLPESSKTKRGVKRRAVVVPTAAVYYDAGDLSPLASRVPRRRRLGIPRPG